MANTIYDNNIKLLVQKNPSFVKHMQTLSPYPLNLEKSRSGQITAKYEGKYLHSSYDPVKEAKVRVEKNINFEDSYLVFSMGFGLGHEVREIVRNLKKKGLLVIIIINPELFLATIQSVDIRDIILSDKVTFLDGTRNDFKSFFHGISDLILFNTIGMSYFFHPVETVGNSEIEKRVKGLHTIIKDVIGYRVAELGNDPRDSIEGLLRIMHNFDHILKSPNMKSLKGKLEGVPAVCIASGPSLDKNMHLLKELEGKALLMAVESNIPKLVNAGINFNSASVHERVPASYYQTLKGVEVSEDVVFIGESVAYHKLYESHPGKNVLIFRDSTVAERIFGEALDELNLMPTGISVAHMVFSLAHFLGCSPIILVGQDLAYSEEGFGHTKDTVHKDSDITAEEIKETVGLVHDEIYLKGNDGGTVKSLTMWKDMLDWFEIYIEKNNIECINATEGGAFIEGTEVMTLRDVIDQRCTKELPFKFSDLFTEASEFEAKSRKKQILKVLENEEEELENFLRLIKSIEASLEKIKAIIDGDKIEFDLESYTYYKNHELWQLFNTRLMLFICQANMIDFFRKLVYIDVENNPDDIVKLYNEQFALLGKLYAIYNVTKELFRQGKAFILEGKPFNDDMLELLEMRVGIEDLYEQMEGENE